GEDMSWTAGLERFYEQGRLLCRYNVFREVRHVVLPDDQRLTKLFGREVNFLWLPDDAPADLGRHLAKLFRLRLVSETTDSVDCEPGQLDKQCTADLESVRRILIGYIRSEHQEHYRRLLREGKLAALAAAPLKPVSRLTVCYRLGEREIKDSR